MPGPALAAAHAAVGREWEVVAVAGVADGLWPSLRSRGSVLATGPLVDLLDGVHPDAVDTLARGSVALPTNAGCCWWHVAGRGAP